MTTEERAELDAIKKEVENLKNQLAILTDILESNIKQTSRIIGKLVEIIGLVIT